MKLFGNIIILLLLGSHPALSYQIQFENIKPKLTSSLEAENPKLFSGSANLKDVDDAIRKIMTSRLYSRVVATKSSDNIINIKAHIIRIFSSINFTGNNVFSSSNLSSIISISKSQIFDRVKIENSRRIILNHYKNSGFLKTKVSTSIKFNTPGNTQVIYTIVEGPSSKLSKIKINTKNTYLERILLKKVRNFINKRLTSTLQNEIKSIISDYLSENRYFLARISAPLISLSKDQESAEISFDVSSSKKYEILLFGNTSFSTLELSRILKFSTFEKGSDPLPYIQKILTNHYLNSGYANVEISITPLEKKNPHSIWLKVSIKESKKIFISDIIFKGRFSKSTKYYIDFLRKNSSQIISKSFYNKIDFDFGLTNLITHLQNLGFVHAKVSSVRVKKNKSGSELTISVYLEEGPLTLINKINFIGNNSFNSETLIDTFGLKKGSPLNSEIITQGLEKIKMYYDNHGHIEMKILNNNQDIVKYLPNNSSANLLIKIFEGPSVTIKSIIIEGNEKTKDYVILTEIPLKKNSLVTSELLNETRRRLNNLGVFNLVQVSTLERNTKLSDRTLIVSLAERDPGLVRIGLGVTDEHKLTVRGFTGVSYNNISGHARAASLRADLMSHVELFDRPTYKVTFDYLEPFLLSSRTRGRLNITVKELLKIADNATDPDLVDRSNQISLTLERDLINHINLTWTMYKLDTREQFDINTLTPKSNRDQIATMGPAITFDNRDNPFLPSKGYYARWFSDYSSPNIGSSEKVKFYRTNISITNYRKIEEGSNVIWANSIRGGYLENLSDLSGSSVPKSYAFALGGRSTIRGFDAGSQNDRLLPDIELPDVVGQPYIENSQSYYLYKTELRFSLYKNFGAVLFYDAGALFAKGVTQKKPFRQSAGFGFRYNTPFGPVNFEFAFKLDRIPEYTEEDPFRFHFSIGSF